MSDVTRGGGGHPQEYNLLEYVERVARFREGRRAVHIHLSRLKSYNKQDYQLRIAVNTFEVAVKMIDGQLFKLANNDLFFIYGTTRAQEIDDAIMRLRYLFTDDPLVQTIEEGGSESFCTWYDVDSDYDTVLAVARELYDEFRKRQKRLALITGGGGESANARTRTAAPGGNHMANAPQAVAKKVPIDPHRLGELVDAIVRADLSNVMRRQTVYAIIGNRAPHFLFKELFISIMELRDLILPNYDITSNRWLFQYLTEILDKRMLSLMLRNDDPELAQSISLNLNVTSLLSSEFLTFDAGLKPGARGTIIIELQLIDIFSDLAAYTFARDFLHDRGYRICLDGVNEHNFAYIDRDKLGLDLLKLQWTPGMLEERATKRHTHLKELIDATGKARVVMCRVDNQEAVDFGQSLGIAMFQGRHVDRLVPPAPTLMRR
jgi:EAL domain-containing protein (putative c-di-GMP-specific phosphodiesterase class I)